MSFTFNIVNVLMSHLAIEIIKASSVAYLSLLLVVRFRADFNSTGCSRVAMMKNHGQTMAVLADGHVEVFSMFVNVTESGCPRARAHQ
jgi:hypothetical protein